LGSNWFKLDRVVGVNSAAGGTTLIQIFFNVMPAKSTNLWGGNRLSALELGLKKMAPFTW